MNQHHLDKIRDMLTRYLEEHNLRKTRERYTILECVCEEGKHFDVETLLRRLEEKKFHVSRSSVYNTLELLRTAGLVIRHRFAPWSLYELKSAATGHHHLVCCYCDNISEIRSDRIKVTMDSRIPKFIPEYHSLYIYGMCSKCKFRLEREKKKKK